ncbi:MAG: hypothetical protein HYX75_10160 [Acidobacteria bacterium]|nr:hypothetical protein [Acidobacteriota bacterium]
MNYSVPKASVKVKVVMTAGAPRVGMAFVAEAARDHAGHQRLEDMLNEPESFFPLATKSGFVLLNKRNLLYLTTTDAAETDYYINLRSVARREEVVLSLRGRHSTRGTLLIEMPAGMARVQDYINTNRAFLPLLAGRELALINSASIVSLTPVAPRPTHRKPGATKRKPR